MRIVEEKTKEEYEMWHEFLEEISHKNRYFCNHKILDRITKIVNTSTIILPRSSYVYRARIFNEDISIYEKFKSFKLNTSTVTNSEDNLKSIIMRMNESKERAIFEKKKATSFWGYDKENSFVPIDHKVVNNGRANPLQIIYLYCADEPITAASEVRGIIEDYISIAQIELLEDLKIVDLTYELINNVQEEDQFLAYLLLESFRKPNRGEEFQYIPTQYISEYIKSLGFDGIKYCSSLYPRGRNYAIFNYDKCVPINSSLYSVEDVCYNLSCIAPVDNNLYKNAIYHWKLETYIESRKKNLLKIPILKK